MSKRSDKSAPLSIEPPTEKKPITIMVSVPLLNRADKLRKRLNCTRSYVVEKALESALRDEAA